MNLINDKITINSFNCRGLRDLNKRNAVFNWLKTKHLGLTLLQETHSTLADENYWENQLGGQIFYSHGTFQSKGVAILIPKHLAEKVKVNNIKRDNEGRIIILDCQIDDNDIILANIYAPTKDHQACSTD